MSMHISSASRYESETSKYMKQIASGKKINSAADDASGMAIANKLKTSITSSSVSASNYRSQVNKANVADSAMSGMNDYLSDMSAESIRASNGTFSSSDKTTIYDHMNLLSQGMNSLSETTYNEQKVVSDSTASAVSGASYDLSSIDSAVNSLYSAMAANGAASNAASYSAKIADTQAINQTAALSRTEDADIAKASVSLSSESTLDQTRIMLQKKMMNDQEDNSANLFLKA